MPPRYFNPRSHVGSDSAQDCNGAKQNDFNPRSHVGSDVFAIIVPDTCIVFQSTLPRRERHSNADGLDDITNISIHVLNVKL